MRVLAAFVALALAISPGSAAQPAASRPRLVVVISVDQMRGDFLTRFPRMYQGGLARLIKEGAVFTDAHHNHSGTETSPGHATLSTGAFPSRHGIIANEWFDRSEGKTVYSVDDPATRLVGGRAGVGRSPKRLMTPALGDWLKRASPGSKVFAVAGKDRSAVLMAGSRPDGAYWYDDGGNMVTSTYYARSVPDWVTSFNASRPLAQYHATGWSRLFPADSYSASSADSVPEENDGVHVTFPHPLDSAATKGRHYTEFKYSPWFDDYTLRFARELVTREALGQDDTPDILWVGCSAADYVGHRYGPFSQESQDQFLRLDRYLGDFFAFLDERVGKDRYTIALSADHGALPLPEELARHGQPAQRILERDIGLEIGKAQVDVAQQLGITAELIAGYAEGIMLHYSAARAKGINQARLQEAMAARLRQIPYVADVYTHTEMKSGTDGGREYFAAFQHSFYDGRSADLMIRYRKWAYAPAFSRFGTSHGSPYEYDSNVALVMAGAGTVAGRHPERVATADLAATLARILGVKPDGVIDGQVLETALAR